MSDGADLTDKIRGAFAPRSLGAWPTPLEPAPALARAVGLEALWLKREDRSSARYGGSKVRGLEFLLSDAAPGTACVTVGGAGSTHCLATAVAARALGLHAVVAQFPQPETELARAVARACERCAARVFRAGVRAALPLALWRAWRAAGRLGPRRWIPGGGAHPRAVLGHLLATLELDAQLAGPADAIVVPLGSGGTAAGIALGIGALRWPTRVIAVRVAPAIVANRWRVAGLARRAVRLLQRRGVPFRIPHAAFPIEIMDGLGPGYGHPTPAGEAARRLAGAHGVVLDSTYGAKAFAFVGQRATCNPKGLPNGRVQRLVFWHTFAPPPAELGT